MMSVLRALQVACNLFGHSSMKDRSEFIISAEYNGLLTVKYRGVLSVNNLILELAGSTIPLMYIKNISGPVTELWGTPA